MTLLFEKITAGATTFSDYNVTGIEIYFNTAIPLPGGKLASSILTIAFADAMAWDTFKSTWLKSDTVFDLTTLTFTTSDASKAALKNILGLSLMAVEAPAMLRWGRWCGYHRPYGWLRRLGGLWQWRQ